MRGFLDLALRQMKCGNGLIDSLVQFRQPRGPRYHRGLRFGASHTFRFDMLQVELLRLTGGFIARALGFPGGSIQPDLLLGDDARFMIFFRARFHGFTRQRVRQGVCPRFLLGAVLGFQSRVRGFLRRQFGLCPRLRRALQFGFRTRTHLGQFALIAFRGAACLDFALCFLLRAMAQFGFVHECARFVGARFFGCGQFTLDAQLVLRGRAGAGFIRDPSLGFRRGGLLGFDTGFRFRGGGGFGVYARQR